MAAAATRDPPRVQIDALMEELARAEARDPGTKSIVFSQFTQFLDLVEWCLERQGAIERGDTVGEHCLLTLSPLTQESAASSWTAA